jgi:general secretion pathway protein D
MLRDETVRRQESQIVAQQIIAEGRKLYYETKYSEAIAKFEQGLKILPRAQATEIDYDTAVRGLSDSYTRLADNAYRANDMTKARDLAKKSLEYEPSNRAAENIIFKIKQSEQQNVAKAERAATEAKKPKPTQTKATQTSPPLPPMPRIQDADETPVFKANQETIRKLFREARILTNSGQYDEAELRYKSILRIDHYNEDAYKNLQDIQEMRLQAVTEGSETARRHRLWQVTEAWIPSVSSEAKIPEKVAPTQTINVNAAERAKIESKLTRIKFPEVNFREAAISDVVKFLSEESIKYDPDQPQEGVSIVLGAGVSAMIAAPTPAAPAPDAAAPAPAPGVPAPVGAPPVAAPAAGGSRSSSITLSLRNVPMDQVLKYVTQLSGLKYRVDASAIVLLPSDSVEGEMVTRSFNVSPDAIRSLLTGGAAPTAPAPQLGGVAAVGMPAAPLPGAPGGAPAAGGAGAGNEELRMFFVNAGVPFPTGSSITYFERARMIYVRNTVENLEVFEKILSTFSVVPSQVEIEAKFIDINQNDLDELGFQWSLDSALRLAGANNGGLYTFTGGGLSSGGATNVPNFLTQGLRGVNVFGANAVSKFLLYNNTTAIPDTIGQFSGVLTDPQFQLIINALNQKKSADVLSAPKVTTISGAQAQIRVVQEFIYPSEYSQPTVANGSVPTPSIPTAFKTREVGVILNVTPTVGADGYTINLTLVPEVSDFIGMLDYSPGVISSIDTNLGIVNVPYKIWQPLFETRNLTTSVVVWDGQTVVLGGLIREEVSKVDDKVPFLGDIPFIGRLFRSKANNRVKRNLLVFVTARLIDPAGNLIHRPDTAGFRLDTFGNPIRPTETPITR